MSLISSLTQEAAYQVHTLFCTSTFSVSLGDLSVLVEFLLLSFFLSCTVPL